MIHSFTAKNCDRDFVRYSHSSMMTNENLCDIPHILEQCKKICIISLVMDIYIGNICF